jgi:hypothetical protein
MDQDANLGCRNGTASSIKEIVNNLNNAQLDPNVGMLQQDPEYPSKDRLEQNSQQIVPYF